ncbi:MAG: T9SS type A sorting domain-containing protein [Flavobacteriales bacterium]|nr:T9SS type A sorting domain-containing protein [Flavobacteriales bacterium]
MKHFAILCLFVLTVSSDLPAQVTWADDVAEIVYANCATCHRDAGIAPFPLIDYTEDVAPNVNAILEAVGTGYMPPWTADSDYQDYLGERLLSSEEVQTIVDWVANGSPEGSAADAPPPPVFNDAGFITATPDLEVRIPDYVSNASATFDDYVCFAIPTGLTEDKKLRAFEVIPGNTEIVHHALVYIDAEGDYETDTSGLCGGPALGLIGGYTPGGQPTIYPSDGQDMNLGVTIPAGSNLVFAMHYPNGSAGQLDSTKVRLFFYEDDTQIREVTTFPLIQDWEFTIEANAVEEVTAEWSYVPEDVSFLNVFPHMHLLGDYIESYAVTLAGDTIPLVRIPHWDFDWQEFYNFQNLIHIPAWTTIHGRGIYENTPGNPHNPNDPPVDVGAGLNTTDEMFLVYFSFLAYEEGDENIDLEELTQLPTDLNSIEWVDSGSMHVYPNPSNDILYFEMELERPSQISIYLYDQHGRLVERIADQAQRNAGMQRITFDTEGLNAGIYFYSVNLNGDLGSGKVLIR